MCNIYSDILTKRGFRELPYQKDFLTNPKYRNPKLPLVLAAGTSSGKTFMSIMELEMFYSNPANRGKRTLFIPSSRTVLRDNTATELKDFNPSFTYCVASNAEELSTAITQNCDVIVALPQTLIGNVDSLPHFHNFVLDEAHQWYFKGTIQTLLKRIKPEYQLLLTGTPSRFVAKGNKFLIKFVPVMELYELEQVSNVKVEVVTSSYKVKQSDYTSTFGNLKAGVKMTDRQSNTALMNVCKGMIGKLHGDTNVTPLSKKLFNVFDELGKTIIYCYSLSQANAFYKSLTSFKGLQGKVMISHSQSDTDSSLFEQFRTDSHTKVLVAVDRGRLGYNMPELFNVVDFTLTQSLDMLLQMYGRLLRKSQLQPDRQKIYYKVASIDDSLYYGDLMTAMFCLTTSEYYTTYNGKNMGGIIIPRLPNPNPTTQSSTNGTKSKSTKQYVSFDTLGIPLDLSLLKRVASHNSSDTFSTVSQCTLDDVRYEFYGMTPQAPRHNQAEVEEAISKCSSIEQLKKEYRWAYAWCSNHKRKDLFTSYYYSIKVKEVKEVISKCSSIQQLDREYRWAYSWCNNHKRKDLLEPVQRIINKSEDDVKEVISKCSSIKQLVREYRWAYAWCSKHKRMELLEPLRVPKRRNEDDVKAVFDAWRGTPEDFQVVHMLEFRCAKQWGKYSEWATEYTTTQRGRKFLANRIWGRNQAKATNVNTITTN